MHGATYNFSSLTPFFFEVTAPTPISNSFSSVVFSLSLTKAYAAETSCIGELLLHESSLKAAIDSLLHIALSFYIIISNNHSSITHYYVSAPARVATGIQGIPQ